MHWCWEWNRDHGMQTYDDYPYETKDTNGCRNQQEKKIASKSAYWGWYPGDVNAMANDLVNYGPLSIALSAGNDCFRFY